MDKTMGSAAAAYAAFGWAVIQLRPRAKTPRHKGWKSSTSAEFVAALWEAHPDCNIAIEAGASGLVVADADTPAAVQRLQALVGAEWLANYPWKVATSRGLHVYLADDGSGWRPSVGRGDNAGLDLRAGRSYVVAPCSVHPNGHTYRWATPDGRMPGTPPEPPPAALAEALRPPAPAHERGVHRRPLWHELTRMSDAYGAAALTGLAAVVRQAPEGTRNATLNAAAYRAGQLAADGRLNLADAVAALEAAALAAGLEPAEVNATLASGARAGAGL